MAPHQNLDPGSQATSPSKSIGQNEDLSPSPTASLARGNNSLEALFVYGVKPDVHGGIFFAGDNSTLLYASGCGISMYNSKA